MKNIVFAFWFIVSIVHAAPATESAPSFDFTGVNVAQVIQLIYSEAIKSDYVIEPDVLSDARNVSFRYKGSKAELLPFVSSFLGSLGYGLSHKNGVDYIAKLKPEEKAVNPDDEVHVYRPRYRDGGYLARILQPLFKGHFTQNKQVQAIGSLGLTKDVPATSAAGVIDQDVDVLVFSGPEREIQKLVKLYPQLDLPVGEVVVKAAIYEVSSTKMDGGAFQLMASVLSGKLGVSIDTGATPLGNTFSIKLKGLDAVVSALSTDNRFTVITQPKLRVKSGETSRLVVGQEVPVVGSVTYNGNNAIRSIEYRSSGTIMRITPTVRENVIDIKYEQQLSNFVRTDTGVNDSPTLIKRELTTTISAFAGDVIVLGGLTENKNTVTRRSPPVFRWPISNADDTSTTDVLLVVEIEKI